MITIFETDLKFYKWLTTFITYIILFIVISILVFIGLI